MEVKTQLSADLAYCVREAARIQGVSVAQYLREAARMKVQADLDGVVLRQGQWLKQGRLTWGGVDDVIR